MALHDIAKKIKPALGPSSTHIVGRLKEWDITSRLGEIRIPTLVTSGRYDECTPTQAAVVRDGIPNCTWVVFEESSHLLHAEETKRYLWVLNDLLTEIEGHPCREKLNPLTTQLLSNGVINVPQNICF